MFGSIILNAQCSCKVHLGQNMILAVTGVHRCSNGPLVILQDDSLSCLNCKLQSLPKVLGTPFDCSILCDNYETPVKHNGLRPPPYPSEQC